MKTILVLLVLTIPLLANKPPKQPPTDIPAKEVDPKKEFRFEGTMGRAKEGFDPVVFKKAVLADDLLDGLIKKHPCRTRNH